MVLLTFDIMLFEFCHIRFNHTQLIVVLFDSNYFLLTRFDINHYVETFVPPFIF
jgi:hypothetical protein